jgi:membrane associated rhomboid family serine protease
MELPGLGGDWDEDEGYDDEDGDEGFQEDEENFSALLQHQMNATWRSNLLPRSRFLELTVFKKMLSQGLHLTRHDGGIVKPTTVFADPEFRHLWWYKSVGFGVANYPISSLLAVGTATDPKSGSTRQEVIDITTIQEEDYPVTFSLTFSGDRIKKKDKLAQKGDKKGNATTASSSSDTTGRNDKAEKHDVFFTCDSVDLFHLVLDGFGMILEHAEAAAMDEDSPQAAMTAHKQLDPKTRALLLFHQLYRPEHHPNHPRRVLRNGQEVEVLYSSEYVVEFNGQLMRLPNPFFGPGMNCRGKIVAFDEETDNYTVAYMDGPFEHDEAPNPEKKNFPKGTVFEYVKRANMIVALGNMYTPHIPITIIVITLFQLIGTILVYVQPSRPEWIFGMQLGMFKDHCPDVRGEIWRLWTYQFLPNNIVHFIYNLIVQLVLGLPLNAVHGNFVFLLLHQGLAIPLALLSVAFGDANKMVSGTVVGATGGVFAIIGVYLGNLLLNYGQFCLS